MADRRCCTLAALLLVLPALAQDPTTSPARGTKDTQGPVPAITVLLQQERSLDAAALRARYAEVIATPVGATPSPTGAWLSAADRDVIGGRDGVSFRIRSLPVPRALAHEALQHLAERDRSRLAGHRAQLVVTLDAAATGDVRHAYHLLGGVVLALLSVDAVGIGAAHHTTFERMDKRVRDGLAGDDALDALAPEASTSLVVFLARARELDADTMGKAIGAEFGVRMATVRDREEQKDFVLVDQALGVVNVDGAITLISVRPRIEPANAPADLRSRNILDDHTAVLHLVSTGRSSPSAEAARRRLVARIASALWANDCLGLNWHCDLRLVPADDLLPKKLRSEDPVAATLGDERVPVLQATDEQAMQAAIEEARATWATAVAHHRGGGDLSAKFPFATKKGGHEHIWIAVTKIDGAEVHGTIANDPVDVAGRKLHDPVTCKLAELSDWLFLRDGEMVGGHTVKVLDEQQKRRPK